MHSSFDVVFCSRLRRLRGTLNFLSFVISFFFATQSPSSRASHSASKYDISFYFLSFCVIYSETEHLLPNCLDRERKTSLVFGGHREKSFRGKYCQNTVTGGFWHKTYGGRNRQKSLRRRVPENFMTGFGWHYVMKRKRPMKIEQSPELGKDAVVSCICFREAPCHDCYPNVASSASEAI